MLKLGLIGYFNFGNYGDQLFLKVFDELFPEANLSVLHSISRPPYFLGSVKKKVASVDGIVIGGGDLVIPWSYSALYWRDEYLDKPVFIVGVGVPTWRDQNDEVMGKLKAFFQHKNVKYIQCRDKESANWIRSNLKPNIEVVSAPDLACALQYQEGCQSNEPVFGLVTRAQPQIDFSNIYNICGRAVSLGYSVRNIVLGTDQIKKADSEVSRNFKFPYQKIVEVNDIDGLSDEIAKCHVVCSMKFHGCVVAYMMGIPVISLSRADKFVSFFKEIGKELFLSGPADKTLPSKLIDPMYVVSDAQIAEIKRESKQSLLRFREVVMNQLDH